MINITGQKFGSLTVLRENPVPYIGPDGKKKRRWDCICDCGKQITVTQNNLTKGHTKSCGCRPNKMDLTGERFGRLTVIRENPVPHIQPGGTRDRRWDCICDCGKQITVRQRLLRSGKTSSCGCLTARQLAGKRFGRLTVISHENGRKWKCICDCGNEKIVDAASLLNGATTSCGCYNSEALSKRFYEVNQFKYYNGTGLYHLTRKVSPSSKSGVKGVTWIEKKKKWLAGITIRKKYIYLGCYDTIEEAAEVRKAAEEKYFKPAIEEIYEMLGRDTGSSLIDE